MLSNVQTEYANYATCLHQQFDVVIEDEFLPFLYPNQYVNFTADSLTVAKGAELAYGSTVGYSIRKEHTEP